MNNENLTQLLLFQPEIILNEELNLIKITQKQAEDNLKINEIEEPIKSEVDMNQALKNIGQRKVAFIELLKPNTIYQDLKKLIPLQDIEIRKAQAHLSFQKELQRSYLAIAGMK